jgi:hypothetical protein
VIRTLLPRNWNFAIAQAAASPKSTLAGTEIAAVSSVSQMAARASLSVNAAKYVPTPLRKASTKTAASGRTRKHTRNNNAMVVSPQRTQRESCMAREPACGWRVLSWRTTAAMTDQTRW